MSTYHFWLGNISGYVWACSRTYTATPKRGERLKYLGHTTDITWPKKLNTGRVLHKPNKKFYKKQKRRFKQSSKLVMASQN